MSVPLNRTIAHIYTAAQYARADAANIRGAFNPIPTIYAEHSEKPPYWSPHLTPVKSLLDMRPTVLEQLREPLGRSVLARADELDITFAWKNRKVLKQVRKLEGHTLLTPDAGNIILSGAKLATRAQWTARLFVATNATGTWTLAGIEALAADLGSPELATFGLGMYAFSWITYGLMFAVGGSACVSLFKGKKPRPSPLLKRFPDAAVPPHRY